MKIYLVGGAIRDELLGLPVKEKDWVVVGATPEELLAMGYQPVGKDFPVFLHPETYEEYALARTERKVGKGYKGFTFHTDPDVTLEDDLKRRDLTINAMARWNNHDLVDPYHGQKDLKNKTLRHISPAFAEDPVRILRVARFSAKLPDFKVDKKTNQLMHDMVNSGEVNALVSERVWKEFFRALLEKAPKRFFEVLEDCGALAVLFPMINLNNYGMMAFERATAKSSSGPIRFATLMHSTELPAVKQTIQRYRIPKEFSELAILSCQYTKNYQDCLKSDAENLLHFIKVTDALRRPNRFNAFLQICKFCIDDHLNEQRIQRIQQALQAIQTIDTTVLQEKELQGKDFADALYALQIKEINKIL